MNRIRELRTAAGLTQAELADRIGTSSVQVGRLEAGERRLTVEWMQRIAEALECSPADLIVQAMVAEGQDDVMPAELHLNGVAAAIKKRGLTVYQVTGNSVSEAGILPGSIITVDESAAAIAAAQSGDVVLVEFGNEPSMLALRQLVQPQLLVTNRRGANLAIRLDDRSIGLNIRGVVVRD